jgi:hypothetical protein
MAVIRRQLALAVDQLDNATGHVLEAGAENPDAAHGVAAYYLKLFGLVAGGAMMARAAIVAQDRLEEGGDGIDRAFYEAKLTTARFYVENLLPQTAGLATPILQGPTTLRMIPDEAL